ncbi:hypothetical protein K439DRAFT_1649327 [Ramaria rubella]|nr:hypothetical protein K439DRAFT_1649327 [Ramaria rubella]
MHHTQPSTNQDETVVAGPTNPWFSPSCNRALHTLHLSRNTVHSYIAALKAWHVTHNMPWHGSARLAYVVNGVANLAPPASIRAPWPPITKAMLQALYNVLDLAEPFHAAVFTVACDAFWGQCQLGKLLCDTLNTFNGHHHPTIDLYNLHPNSVTITLPWTKTKKGRGEIITLAHQIAPLDPATTHKLHWAINRAPVGSHLYAYACSSTFVPLTKSVFLCCCNKIWADTGTTELLLTGVPPDIVKAMGCWDLDTFLVYWRSLNELAPLHAVDIPI